MLFPPKAGLVELRIANPRSGALATLRAQTLSHAERVAPIEARE
jgi:hypothetical protein